MVGILCFVVPVKVLPNLTFVGTHQKIICLIDTTLTEVFRDPKKVIYLLFLLRISFEIRTIQIIKDPHRLSYRV